jgi:hypothetical protein
VNGEVAVGGRVRLVETVFSELGMVSNTFDFLLWKPSLTPREMKVSRALLHHLLLLFAHGAAKEVGPPSDSRR